MVCTVCTNIDLPLMLQLIVNRGYELCHKESTTELYSHDPDTHVSNILIAVYCHARMYTPTQITYRSLVVWWTSKDI